MKTKTTFFSMALLIAFLLLGCSNDESTYSDLSSKVPRAPIGSKVQYLSPGSTVSQIRVQGSNIKWYLKLNDLNTDPIESDDLIEINNSSGMGLLSPNAVVRNNTTYYATQTVNNIQSNDFLGVTVYCYE